MEAKFRSLLVLAVFYLGLAQVSCSFWESIISITDDNSEWDATYARNLRSECKVLFMRANEAQQKMFEAENEDDVNGYEKYLSKMREEDKKLQKCVVKYEQVRDFLEAQIWQGQLFIHGFEKRYQKSTSQSILDMITGKAKY